MGWPLILALAGMGLQAGAQSKAGKLQHAYGLEQAEAKQEALNRELEAASEKARKEALMRALASQPQPTAIGKETIMQEDVEEPNLNALETLNTLGGVATNLGGYYSSRVSPRDRDMGPPKDPSQMTNYEWQQYVQRRMK